MAGIKLNGWRVKCPSCGKELQLYQYSSEKNPRLYFNCNNDIADCNDRHLYSNKFTRPDDIKGHAIQPYQENVNVAVQEGTIRDEKPRINAVRNGNRAFADL